MNRQERRKQKAQRWTAIVKTPSGKTYPIELVPQANGTIEIIASEEIKQKLKTLSNFGPQSLVPQADGRIEIILSEEIESTNLN